MRKLLISLLLASAAASPALADPDNHNDRHAAKAERQQAREQARVQPPVQVQRPQFNGQGRFSPPPGPAPQAFVRPDVQQVRQPNGDPRDAEAFRAQRGFRGDAPDSVRNGRGREQVMQDRQDRVDNEALRHSDRPLPPVMRTRVPVISVVPRPGTQPPLRVDNRRRDEVRWDTNWRRDDRHDWRRWRDRHRSWFSLGIYYDPFGWGYQPYSIGWRMWPSYYGSSFWINDPWEYRLPYAPPGTRWVRYYNDAILVDMWSGEVVDVVYDFFW